MESRVGVGPRLGAYLIDTLLVMGAAYLLRDVAAALAPQAVQVAMAQQPKGEVPPDLQAWVLTAARASVAASLLGPFYGLVEGLSGASPGKLLLGLRVVTTEGHRAPIVQLLERFVIKGGPNLLAFAAILTNLPGLSTAASGFAFLVILGGLLILGAKRQAIHDLAARTAVLRRSDVVR